MNKIIKNTIKIFVITLVLTFGLLFAQKAAQAFPDAYVTSYNITTYQDVPVYSDCYWIFYSRDYRCNIKPNRRKPGGGSNLCVPGGYWVYRNCSDNKECYGNVNYSFSNIYYSSCDFNNAYCDNEPWHAPGGTYVSGYNRIYSTVTNYTCHYISAVNSWTPCSMEGVQVATSVTWSTVSGTSCSNVPLTRSCTPPPRDNLAINFSGAGFGRVTSNPAGIDCYKETSGPSGSGTCNKLFERGKLVFLSYFPNTANSYCSGGACGPASVLINAGGSSATANFTLKPKLNVTISGCGTIAAPSSGWSCSSPGGTKTCDSNPLYVNPNTSVALTTSACANSHFGSWGGACSGTGACSVNMGTTDKSVAAYFASQSDCSCDTDDCRSTCLGQTCDDTCGNPSCEGTLSCPLWQEVQP